MPAKDLDQDVVDHLLTTTRSVRKRLDLGRPVPLGLVEECLEIALQAPSGSNSQGWEILVLTDPGKKQALARVYAESLAAYARGEVRSLIDAGLNPAAGYPEGDARSAGMSRILESAGYLAEILDQVPVHVVFCAPTRLEGADTLAWTSVLGSILPSAWSFMLAARARGLGSAWTTIHLAREREAAQAIGIPDEWTQLVMIPVAWYTGDMFRPAPRRALADVVHWNAIGERRRPAPQARRA